MQLAEEMQLQMAAGAAAGSVISERTSSFV